VKEERYYLVLNDDEQSLLRSLNDERTAQLKNGKAVDSIDELIVKVGKAPLKKIKVFERSDCCAR
jgi:hypothetical protein